MIQSMPIYEYRCDNGDIFEAMQSFTDEPLTECEVCGAPVQRVMYAPAIHFKGNGFYSTDYARRAPAGSDDHDSDKGTASSSSSQTENQDAVPEKATVTATSPPKSAGPSKSSGD